ncbi:putative haloacid dehalogenase, group II [Balamuthia mandrillaris]
MMKQYAPFSQVTEEALRFSLKCCQYTRDNESPVHVVCELLLKEYNRLPPYPEVKNALSQLKARGYKLAVLSNGTPQMLKEGVASAGLQEGLFDELISVDEVQLYKPDPQVYALAMRKLGLDSPQEVCYVSGNGWDVAGAANFGFQTGSS